MADFVVKIKQGLIKGEIKEDIDGNSYSSFLGIPFGKPPIGPLRFKDPVPAEPWTGIRDGSIEGNCCFALQFIPDKLSPMKMKLEPKGSEDCLILNVYTPRVKNDDKTLRPVMVFIHGGAFVTGGASPYMLGPDLLVTQNVILVTVQYRLGALGFLSIVDKDIGNAGLKDLVLSLKWIQENIEAFGGDRGNVTIFGESAGSSAVHFLILSSQTKGLFHRAICQSGVAINTWSRGSENNAFQLAKLLGSTETDPEKVLEFLQGVPKEDILEIQTEQGDSGPSAPRYYSPTVEKESANSFISKEPIELITTNDYNHIPMIIGMTSEEGKILPILQQMQSILKVEYTDFVPFFAGYKKGSPEYEEVNKKIMKFYIGSTSISDVDYLEKLIRLTTDSMFARGINSSVKEHSKIWKAPIYYYIFSYDTKLSMAKAMGLSLNIEGTSHGEDLAYLFSRSLAPPIEKGTVEDLAWRKFVKLWTNFAKTGNPTPNRDSNLENVIWKPVGGPNELTYLDINETLKLSSNPFPERNELWDEILKNAPGY